MVKYLPYDAYQSDKCSNLSGISVISLAIQLANGIKTLHEFWSSVRDAPSDIKEIIDDLQCLGSLLNEIANGGNHSVTLVLALETCEGKVKVSTVAIKPSISDVHC